MDRVVRFVKIKPKKWGEFQHYKAVERPTWIKLHRKLLDDVAFQRLPRSSQALAPMLWLIASEHPEGLIDANPEDLAFRLRWPEQEMIDALSPLIGKGFFEIVQFPASDPIAGIEPVYSASSLEKSREDKTREETPLVPLPRDGGRLRKAQIKTEALQYLDFLNAKAGKHFKPVPSNLRLIEARLAEGVSLQDLKTLTIRKCREWLGSDMAKFLRPETLCNATKCQSYLGEIEPEEPAPGDPPCNAPPAIEASSSIPSRAAADGPPLTNLEPSPALH